MTEAGDQWSVASGQKSMVRGQCRISQAHPVFALNLDSYLQVWSRTRPDASLLTSKPKPDPDWPVARHFAAI